MKSDCLMWWCSAWGSVDFKAWHQHSVISSLNTTGGKAVNDGPIPIKNKPSAFFPQCVHNCVLAVNCTAYLFIMFQVKYVYHTKVRICSALVWCYPRAGCQEQSDEAWTVGWQQHWVWTTSKRVCTSWSVKRTDALIMSAAAIKVLAQRPTNSKLAVPRF